MTVKEKMVLFYALAVIFGVVAAGLSTTYRSPLPLFPWLAVFGFGSFFIRCPNCGKPVLATEWWRGAPFPFWSSRTWPERTCSRCGTQLL
jgi:hypothetical protein